MITLAVPAVGWLGIAVASESIETQWLAAVETEYGPIATEDHAAVRLDVLCTDPEAARDFRDACNETTILGILRVLDVAAAALAVVVLVVASGTALATRGSRRRMVVLFRPALVVVLATTALLLLAEAAVVTGLVLELMLWIGSSPSLIIVVAGVMLAGVAGVTRAMTSMTDVKPIAVRGTPLGRESDGLLFAEVDQIVARLGTTQPVRILAGLEPNFFVVDAPFTGWTGSARARPCSSPCRCATS